MKAKSLPERLLIGRQIAAVTTAFMIPVSTSGQAIAVSMFVLLVALTAKREEWLVTFATPAAAVPVGLISVAIDRHVVVANPVGPWRGYRSLCKIVAHSRCNGRCFHSAGGASNRLRVFGGMFSGAGPFIFVFFHTFAASVSPSDGRCAVERQCRSKRMFCALRLCAGLGRRQRVGFWQPEARSCNDYLGIGIPCRHLLDFHFEDRPSL